MKKTSLFIVVAVLVFMALGSCAKNDSPTTPAAATNTPTPNATQIAAAAQTAVALQTAVAVQTAAAAQTAVAVQTAVAAQTAVTALSYKSIVSVPGGTFTQSDENGNNSFVHTISAFQIGQYEVTYELWYTVYQWAIYNGYAFANAGMEGNDGTSGAAPTTAKYEPVTTINWRDMIIWCNAYSQMTGLTPVYCSDSGFTTPIKNSTDGVYASSINTTPGGFDNPYANWSATGYRLPTHGEAQYAARYIDGSSWTPYNYASGATAACTDATATGLVAWYSANSGFVTHDVGGKTVNSLGLYDMSGNVWEWCWDSFGTTPGTSVDYRGPASTSGRLILGGSFDYDESSLRVGGRVNYSLHYEGNIIGFRFARTQ